MQMLPHDARVWVCAALIGLTLGCATRPSSGPHWASDHATLSLDLAICVQVFEAVDKAVGRAGVRDAEAATLPGFPHLRINRFLASFRNDDLPAGALPYWAERLAELDRQGRFVEVRNLPRAASERLRDQLRDLTTTDVDTLAVIDDCREALLAYDGVTRLEALRRRGDVPDHYDGFQRAVGVYPLTSMAVAAGFSRWQEENLGSFDRAWQSLPVRGDLIEWRPSLTHKPLDSTRVARIVADAPVDPLGTPRFSDQDLVRLAEAHAPVLLIDTVTDADVIGRPLPAPRDGSGPFVDASDPVAFVRIAYTRFDGEVLPQIVYTMWFDARPPAHDGDVYAGRLDGLTWRVTLSLDGRPLIYDTIHPCGCYHLFFPVDPVRRKWTEEDADRREEALTPAAAPMLEPNQRILLRVEAGTHYLVGVGTSALVGGATKSASYRLSLNHGVPDLELRSIPTGRPERPFRSLYGPTGVVAGTERLERFLLWPMGIESAGAMRQWGTHATAFVGRRHFDDPFLMDKSFRRPDTVARAELQ